MQPLDSADLIDFFQVPAPPDGYVVPKDIQILIGDLAGGKVYRSTLSLLLTALAPQDKPVPVAAFLAPANGTTLTIGVPTFLQVSATDALGIKSVEFFAAGKSIGLGNATGSTYTLPYTPTAGTTVNFAAKVTNTAGTEANASVFAQLVTAPAANVKPVVTLQALGSGYAVGQLMALNATATVSGGTIAKVEFFDGGTLIGIAQSTPYSATYTLTSAGKHYFTAKATDALGNSTVSAVQTVEVAANAASTNVNPVVRLISATPNPATVGQQLILTAGASDSDGTVVKVEFFDGTNSVGVKTETPYAVTILPTIAGQHVYFVKATDNNGGTSTDSLTVLVNAASTTPVTPGATTPNKPTIAPDDAANTLAFGSPLGTSEIVVSINDGAYEPYAGPYAVGDVDRVAGYYKAKIRSASGRNESEVTSSPAYTKATVVVAPSFADHIQPNGYKDTVTWIANANTVLDYNGPVQPFATVQGNNAMMVFLNNLNPESQIGALNYDPADEGRAFGVTINETAKYTSGTMTATKPDGTSVTTTGLLKFTNGTVVLSL